MIREVSSDRESFKTLTFDHFVEPRLTDATETGGLFGIRFN